MGGWVWYEVGGIFLTLGGLRPPMGFKRTSEIVTISFSNTEVVPGTMNEVEIDLNLDILSHEIFVILAQDLDTSSPEAIATVNTTSSASLSTTSRDTIGSLADNNVFGRASQRIRAGGFADGGVGFTNNTTDAPQAHMKWLALLATNNFFIQCRGTNNAGLMSVSGKIWGYRAIADASTFASLVAFEQLSA